MAKKILNNTNFDSSILLKEVFKTHPFIYYYLADDYEMGFSPIEVSKCMTVYLPQLVEGEKIILNSLDDSIQGFFYDMEDELNQVENNILNNFDFMLNSQRFKDWKKNYDYSQSGISEEEKQSIENKASEGVDYFTPLTHVGLIRTQLGAIFKYFLFNHTHQNKYLKHSATDILFLYNYVSRYVDNTPKEKIKTHNSITEAYHEVYNPFIIAPFKKLLIKHNNQTIETTEGRVLFNFLLPKEMEYINEPITIGILQKTTTSIWLQYGNERVTKFLVDFIRESIILQHSWEYFK